MSLLCKLLGHKWQKDHYYIGKIRIDVRCCNRCFLTQNRSEKEKKWTKVTY